MGCFIVPMTEAVVTTVVTHVLKKKEAKAEVDCGMKEHRDVSAVHMPFTRKLGWLNKMLWGGSVLLAFEHLWHGEITPWFPFLTGAASVEDAAVMLREMSTVGVSMAALVTVVWLGMAAVSSGMERKAFSRQREESEAK